MLCNDRFHCRGLRLRPLLETRCVLHQRLCVLHQWFSETHVWSCHIVESLEEGGLLLEVGAFLRKAQGLSYQWCQGLSHGEIESL